MIFFNKLGPNVPHPIHMHGHSFFVMTSVLNDSVTNYIKCENTDCTKASWNGNKPTYDKYPIKKDTIIVPHNGFVVVRINVNNPGDWFMHCHIDRHTEEGMAMVLREWSDMVEKTEQAMPEEESNKSPGTEETEDKSRAPKKVKLKITEGTVNALLKQPEWV